MRRVQKGGIVPLKKTAFYVTFVLLAFVLLGNHFIGSTNRALPSLPSFDREAGLRLAKETILEVSKFPDRMPSPGSAELFSIKAKRGLVRIGDLDVLEEVREIACQDGDFAFDANRILIERRDFTGVEHWFEVLGDEFATKGERFKALYQCANLSILAEDYELSGSAETFCQRSLNYSNMNILMSSHAILRKKATERSRPILEKALIREMANNDAGSMVGWTNRLCIRESIGKGTPAGSIVKALIQIQNPKSIPVLRKVAHEAQSDSVRAHAAIGLHHLGDVVDARETLEALLESIDFEFLREEYVYLLAGLGHKDYLERLKTFMDNPDANVRGQAYQDLNILKDPAFIEKAVADYPTGFEQIVNWEGGYKAFQGRLVREPLAFEYLLRLIECGASDQSVAHALSYMDRSSDEQVKRAIPFCLGVLEGEMLADPIDHTDREYYAHWRSQARKLSVLLRVGSPDQQVKAFKKAREIHLLAGDHRSFLELMLGSTRSRSCQQLLIESMKSDQELNRRATAALAYLSIEANCLESSSSARLPYSPFK